MQRFWDARARENALFFVDDRLDYARPDEASFWARGRADLKYMLELLGVAVDPEDVVVDIGCGVGRLTRVLAEQAAEVLAIDVSGEMLTQARSLNAHLPNVRWLHGDGATLAPIADASVDCCISHVVFQHIPDPAITLGYVREMGRVLRPAGWAAFQVSTDPRIHRVPRQRRAARRLRALAGRAPRGQEDPRWLGSAVELERLRETVSAAGMEIERAESPLPQFCIVLARRRAA